MTTSWPLDPDLRPVTVELCGRGIQIHPDAAGALELVNVRLQKTQYGAWLTQQHRSGRVLSGGYNYRPRSSFRRPDGSYPPVTWDNHSEHAHACAVDCNYTDCPLRTDGYLTCNYARFGREDGAAVMRAWLDPPEGLPVFWRWGGINTTDWKRAAAVLPLKGPDYTVRVGGTFADAHHFDLIRIDRAVLRRYDWRTASEREENELALLDERDQKDIKAFLDTLRTDLGSKRNPKKPSTAKGAAQRVARATLKSEKK